MKTGKSYIYKYTLVNMNKETIILKEIKIIKRLIQVALYFIPKTTHIQFYKKKEKHKIGHHRTEKYLSISKIY